MNDIYIVKKGDNLYGISNQYGVSVTELAELNNVTAATLKEGQSLKIPKKEGIISYPFYCKACNTKGTVYSKMKGEKK